MKFWRSEEIDRPLLTVHVGSYYPVERYPNLARVLPGGPLSPKDFSIPAILRDYDRLRKMYNDVEDDSMFIARILYGFPIMEAILGCPVSVSERTTSFWIEPFLDDWTMLESLPNRVHSGWVDKMCEVIEVLVSQAGCPRVTTWRAAMPFPVRAASPLWPPTGSV